VQLAVQSCWLEVHVLLDMRQTLRYRTSANSTDPVNTISDCVHKAVLGMHNVFKAINILDRE
jgi:hypothetical protein